VETSSSVVFRNVLHLGVAQVATTVLGILGTAALGRALGPSDFGILYLVFAISGFVGVIVDWGQDTYVVREIARGRSDQPELIGSVLLTRATTTACAAIIAAFVGLISSDDARVAFLAPLTVLVVLPATLYPALGFVLRGTDRMGLDATVNVFYKALNLVAMLAALYLGGGLTEVILAQCVGGVGLIAVSASIALRLGLTIKPPTSGVLWELTRCGTPIVLYSLTIAFQPFIEVMVLSALTKPEVVGWYGAFRTIFGIMLSPAMILARASLPQLSRASLSPPDFRRVLNSTARLLLLAAAFASSSLYIFGDRIIAIIFGHGHFQETAAILRVGALVLPLLFLGYLLGTALSAVGRNKQLAFTTGTAVLGSIVASWFSIPFFQAHYGNGGIALVVIAGVAEMMVLVAFVVLLPRGSVGWTMPVNLVRACTASICTVLLLSAVPHLELWILAPLFVLTFSLLALFTGLMSTKDLEVGLMWLRNFKSTFRKTSPG
jgi:O-antigen/teichoic acid export membrane protein